MYQKKSEEEKFRNRSQAQKGKNTGKRKGKTYIEMFGEKKAKEWQENMSKGSMGVIPSISDKRREELRNNAYKMKEGLIKFNKSDKKRKAASERMKQTWKEKPLSMVTGDNLKGFKKGIMYNVRHDSSYEQRRIKFLMENGFSISRSRFIIPYEFENKNYNYFPDFDVRDSLTGILLWVEEIKPRSIIEQSKTFEKLSAGKKYFTLIGIHFSIIFEERLESYIPKIIGHND